MSIIIGADLVPTKSNYDLFETADIKTLVGDELLQEISSADFRIFNLETPITDTPSPIKKSGPAIRTPERVMPGLKELGVNLFAVANNHILDQGEQGLARTVELIEENGIAYVGAGENIADASKPYIFEISGKKIGVYCCAEHEFTNATEQKSGANPFDALETPDHIAALKSRCDYVIALHHGGKEHYRYPSPNLQKVCRKFADKGADLVVCQHSHCIGCEEKYNDATIVYGQGNFLFDYSSSECWKTGLLIKLNDALQVEYMPIIKVDNTVRLACGAQGEKILADFYRRSEQIKDKEFVDKEFERFAIQSIYENIVIVSGNNKFLFHVLNKLTGRAFRKWYVDIKYKKEKYALLNHFECESIREINIRGLKILTGDKK